MRQDGIPGREIEHHSIKRNTQEEISRYIKRWNQMEKCYRQETDSIMDESCFITGVCGGGG